MSNKTKIKVKNLNREDLWKKFFPIFEKNKKFN